MLCASQGISSSVVFLFLRKIKHRKIDVVRSAKMLLKGNAIPKDVIIMFDEMYLKKNEDYVGGKLLEQLKMANCIEVFFAS